MDIFKEGVIQKVRFNTTSGTIGMEQLADMSMTTLSTIVRNLSKELKKDNDDDLSFLDENPTKVDKLTQLKFEIAKSLYLTKKEAVEALKNKRYVKEQREKLLAEKARRKEAAISTVSDAELDKMLDNLLP